MLNRYKCNGCHIFSLDKFNEDDFFVMNISEFLEENNLTVSSQNQLPDNNGNISKEEGKETDEEDTPMKESEEYSVQASPRNIFGLGSPRSPTGTIDSRVIGGYTKEDSPLPSRPSIIVSNKGRRRWKKDNAELIVTQ